MKRAQSLRTYRVSVTRQGEERAEAAARGYTLTLNAKKGGEAGFNAAETLLAALGACLLTNLDSFAAKMRLRVDGARVDFTAVRQEDPPGLVDINYLLTINSPERVEKLQELHELAVKWGTVSNTLRAGLIPNGALRVELPVSSDESPEKTR